MSRAVGGAEPDAERNRHELDHNRIPDPIATAITSLNERVLELTRELTELRHQPVFDDVVVEGKSVRTHRRIE